MLVMNKTKTKKKSKTLKGLGRDLRESATEEEKMNHILNTFKTKDSSSSLLQSTKFSSTS